MPMYKLSLSAKTPTSHAQLGELTKLPMPPSRWGWNALPVLYFLGTSDIAHSAIYSVVAPTVVNNALR